MAKIITYFGQIRKRWVFWTELIFLKGLILIVVGSFCSQFYDQPSFSLGRIVVGSFENARFMAVLKNWWAEDLISSPFYLLDNKKLKKPVFSVHIYFYWHYSWMDKIPVFKALNGAFLTYGTSQTIPTNNAAEISRFDQRKANVEQCRTKHFSSIFTGQLKLVLETSVICPTKSLHNLESSVKSQSICILE